MKRNLLQDGAPADTRALELQKQSRDRGLDLDLALALFRMQPTPVEQLARRREGLDSDGRGGCGYGLLLAPRRSS